MSSQRIPMINATSNSSSSVGGMPIFQSSGLVPLHISTSLSFNMPPVQLASSHLKGPMMTAMRPSPLAEATLSSSSGGFLSTPSVGVDDDRLAPAPQGWVKANPSASPSSSVNVRTVNRPDEILRSQLTGGPSLSLARLLLQRSNPSSVGDGRFNERSVSAESGVEVRRSDLKSDKRRTIEDDMKIHHRRDVPPVIRHVVASRDEIQSTALPNSRDIVLQQSRCPPEIVERLAKSHSGLLYLLPTEETTAGRDEEVRVAGSSKEEEEEVVKFPKKKDSFCNAGVSATNVIDDMIKQDADAKEWQHWKKTEKEEDEEEWVTMENNPFNMRIVNMNNFPVAQSVYRSNYKSHSVACLRAKLGSIQNTAKSLDLLRQLLQKSINDEIDAIIQKYLDEYFRPALDNIRLNNGENAVSIQHLHTVCHQMLEEAKKIYNSDARSTTPDIPDTTSESGSTDEARVARLSRNPLLPRKRKPSSGSESSSSALKNKKRNKLPSHLQPGSGRSTPSKSGKQEMVKREGPMWDADRIKANTLFVMGARANKALGLGATRGRLYIKHPDVFKYCADQDDKQWLYEKHLMPATGGKTYLLIVEDIQELLQNDEYRNSPGLLPDELVGFTAPEWMLEKMKGQMISMRTDLFKPSSILARDATATDTHPRPSPANSDTREVSTEQDDEDVSTPVSPLNETGGFSQEHSPAPSSQNPSEEFDDDTPLTGSFYIA